MFFSSPWKESRNKIIHIRVKTLFFILYTSILYPGFLYAQGYKNPGLKGFNPDPSICRVNGDFYLTTSSFEYFPGLPIYQSRDLIHWKQIGHCLTRNSQLNLCQTPASGGLYAPSLRYKNGLFYVICTNVSGGGNFYCTATNPAAPGAIRISFGMKTAERIL
ncbi:MAG: family 43 glycosylhydrolase [Massilibacteroides sp.]|nr:family 43 glycosylhydrolase [Massilibacteroides sp.]MDD4660400.1 family 43 glycosylhydrolase [Massilibacteroides sp.]